MASPPDIVRITDPAEKSRSLGAIIASLPQWFGVPSANDAYIRDVAGKDTFGARLSGRTAGLLALRYHFENTAEIWWLGVRPEFHRHGLGRALVERANHDTASMGRQFMVVSTLSARHPDLYYARTRAFYKAMGFVPLFEHDDWGAGNPGLWMIRSL